MYAIIFIIGTIIQGAVSVNSAIDIPCLKLQRKVKSIQIFRQSVSEAMQGDRVGVCVTHLDAKLFERGVVCSPGHLQPSYAIIASITRISYFRRDIRTGTKFHITAVHDTVLAKIVLFSSDLTTFEIQEDMPFEEILPKEKDSKTWFVLVEFEQPMICGLGSLILGSKLDSDIHSKTCRLAFYGNAVKVYTSPDYQASLSEIRVFKVKCKTGIVDRVPNDTEVIIKDMFKKETNIGLFTGMKVSFSSGETGVIKGLFGQSGKAKVQLDFDQEMTPKLAKYKSKKEAKGDEAKSDGRQDQKHVTVTLRFKRFVFDVNKKMVQ